MTIIGNIEIPNDVMMQCIMWPWSPTVAQPDSPVAWPNHGMADEEQKSSNGRTVCQLTVWNSVCVVMMIVVDSCVWWPQWAVSIVYMTGKPGNVVVKQ